MLCIPSLFDPDFTAQLKSAFREHFADESERVLGPHLGPAEARRIAYESYDRVEAKRAAEARD